MREIKFRAWHKLDKRWIDIYYLKPQGNGLWVITGNGYGYSPQEIELSQYIGSEDKNGKESYHKDIVRRMDNLYIIEWHDNLASWFLKPICGGWHGITKGDMALMCEVIGNIYSDPHLLDTKAEGGE